MSELVTYALEGKVAVITMDDGKVNALSPDMIEALNNALDQAEKDKAVVILTGRDGQFSGGYDLKVMMTGIETAVKLVNAGSCLARRLLTFPTPVIAACSGNAIAKGAFLLLSCDHRFGVDGYKIGLNEVQIGMTMHNAGIELARGRLNRSYFNRCVINGEMFYGESAADAGFLDEVVAPDKLLESAKALAAQMVATINMRSHKQTKLKAREEYLARLDKAIEKDLVKLI